MAEKTAIYGKVRHELSCVPVKNPESEHILNERARAAMLPKAQVKFGDASVAGFRVIGGGRIADHNYATDFIVRIPTCCPFSLLSLRADSLVQIANWYM